MNFSIGAFSLRTGVSITALRYYEQEALLSPARKPNGQRVYTLQDETWLKFIMQLKGTGMPIREIQRYAALRAQGNTSLQARRDMLQVHRQALVAELQTMRAHLAKLDDKIAYYEDAIQKQSINDSSY